MSFIAQPGILANIHQPSPVLETDPIREIALRISKLSYKDMKRLADELASLNVKYSSFSMADGLSSWADQTLSGSNSIKGL